MKFGELLFKKLLLLLQIIMLNAQECLATDYWRVEGLTFQVDRVREVEDTVVEVVVDGGEPRLFRYHEAVVFLLERSARSQFPTEREILFSLLGRSKFSDELFQLLLMRHDGERMIIENFPALVERAEVPLGKVFTSERVSREAVAEIVTRYQSQLRCHWLYQVINLQLSDVTLGDTLNICLTGDAETDTTAVRRLGSYLTGAAGSRVKDLLRELEGCTELASCLVGFGVREDLGRYFSLRRQRLLATDLQNGRIGYDEFLQLVEPLQLEPLTPVFHELLIRALSNSKEVYISPAIARATVVDPRVAAAVKLRTGRLPFRWPATVAGALFAIWVGWFIARRVHNYRTSKQLYEYFGLTVGAERGELRERFRQRVKLLHPDRCGGVTKQDYLELIENYRILWERLAE